MGKLKNNWRKLGLVMFIIILIIAVGFVFNNYANSPNTGEVQYEAPPSPSASTKAAPKTLDGRFISFKYPAELSVFDTKTSGDALQAASLKSSQPPIVNATIEVVPLPSGQLGDNSSYNYRLQNPSIYKSEPIVAGGQSYPAFADTSGGYSKVAFIAKADKLATVSLTCSDGSQADALDSELKSIIVSIKWH